MNDFQCDSQPKTYQRSDVCGHCGQHATDPRHGHPHDYVGSLVAFEAGHVCLSCNKLHDNQPSLTRLWKE
mgnify:FL=1